MPYDGPEKRHNSDGRDIGGLQVGLMALQREVVLMRTDFKDYADAQNKRFDSLDNQIRVVVSWKDEAAGGMKVARAVWTLWAFVVSTVVGLLGYWGISK